MTEITDECLAVKALQDMESFEALITRYEKKLMHYVLRISHFSPQEAEETLQEVFIKIWKNLNDFDDKMKFSTWAYRITHNHTISSWRKATNRGTAQQVDLEPDVLDQIADEFNFITDLESKFTAQRVQAVLQKLPEKYKTVLILRFLEEKSYEEISDILQKPPGTVATLLNRAKQKFKALYLSSKI